MSTIEHSLSNRTQRIYSIRRSSFADITESLKSVSFESTSFVKKYQLTPDEIFSKKIRQIE